MYGQCSPSGRGDNGHYYCKYDGEAIKQNSTDFLKLFKEVCPNLYNGTDHTSTCCDYDQLKYMDSQLSVPKQLMSRCPACLVNFKSFLCDMTCSSKQGEFIVIPDQSLRKQESSKNQVSITTHENNYDYPGEVENEENKEEHSIKNEKKNEITDASTVGDKVDVITFNYFITNTYVTQMFNSCKFVLVFIFIF